MGGIDLGPPHSLPALPGFMDLIRTRAGMETPAGKGGVGGIWGNPHPPFPCIAARPRCCRGSAGEGCRRRDPVLRGGHRQPHAVPPAHAAGMSHRGGGRRQRERRRGGGASPVPGKGGTHRDPHGGGRDPRAPPRSQRLLWGFELFRTPLPTPSLQAGAGGRKISHKIKFYSKITK